MNLMGVWQADEDALQNPEHLDHGVVVACIADDDDAEPAAGVVEQDDDRFVAERSVDRHRDRDEGRVGIVDRVDAGAWQASVDGDEVHESPLL